MSSSLSRSFSVSLKTILFVLLCTVTLLLSASSAFARQAASVSVGDNFACATSTTKLVECWGDNTYGQLGNGTTEASGTNTHAPVRVSGVTNSVGAAAAATVETGNGFACALLDTSGSIQSQVKCWGRNNFGQLGNGTTTDSSSAVTVSGLQNVKGIAVGDDFACAYLNVGSATCWGNNSSGQLGNGTFTSSSTPVAVSGFTSTSAAYAMSAGSNHVCIGAKNSSNAERAFCWGNNTFGQLGNGTTTTSNVPVEISVAEGNTVISFPKTTTGHPLAAGKNFTCMLRDGTTAGILCWGLNSSGQLGVGSTTNTNIPKYVQGVNGFTWRTLEATENHACATTFSPSSSAKCWGNNSYGQLGDGTTTNRTSAVDAYNSPASSYMAAGRNATCSMGLSTAASIKCWGNNDNGQLGNGIWNKALTPGASVSGVGNASSVSVGLDSACSLLNTGAVQCWGKNAKGQLGNGTTTASLVPTTVTGLTATSVSVGNEFACASRALGTAAQCWGDNSNGQGGTSFTSASPVTTPTSTLGGDNGNTNSSISITAGGNHACATQSDFSGECWGGTNEAYQGQLGNTANFAAPYPVPVNFDMTGEESLIKNITTISAGDNFACALVNNQFLASDTGNVGCWGKAGVNGLGSNTNAINSINGPHGGPSSPLKNATSVSAGSNHACAVRSGLVYCWGSNSSGQLGDTSTLLGVNRSSYVPVTGITNAVSVEAGTDYTCAVLSTATVQCWGKNSSGQLGNGTTSDSNIPVAVSSIANATAVSAGADTTCARLSDATVRCWGSRTTGALGDGLSTQSVSPVDVTDFNGVAEPVNSTRPAITGTLKDGNTLTASNGTWTGTPTITYTYQWERRLAPSGTLSTIAGATSNTYNLTAADIGYQFRVIVTATNADRSATAFSLITSVVTEAAPVNTSAPAITGTPVYGQTVSVDNGTWTANSSITYTYQWQRETGAGTGVYANISGETSSSYTLLAADVGVRVRGQVIATSAGGATTANSAASATITAIAPSSSTSPVVSGTPTDGQTLSVTNGTWNGSAPFTYTYQWQRGSTDIPGAVSSTYQLTSADVGQTIRARVTATNATSASAFSNSTAAVAAIAPSAANAPTISGTTTDGQTLTGTNGTWNGSTPLTYSYQWQRETSGSFSDIAGATAIAYTLTSADVTRRVRLRVTALNAGGSASQNSAQSAIVAGVAPTNNTLPSVTGNTSDGSLLTANPGTWSGTTPTFTYQWQRESTPGTWASISGATANTYTLTSADVGHAVRVQVTATNSAGSLTRTSAATATVTAVAPSNTGLPVITGSKTSGQTLATTDGQWSGTTPRTYSYQWQRETSGSYANISGATAATYQLTDNDIGHQVRVIVTSTNAASSASATSAATSVIAAAAPSSTTLPTVSGTAAFAQILTATSGSYDGTGPFSYAYQWQRETSPGVFADIATATQTTYNVREADIDHRLRVAVTATNAVDSVIAYSLPTASVIDVAPIVDTQPILVGTARDGNTLLLSGSQWTSTDGLEFTYQWQRETSPNVFVNIPGATQGSYQLTGDDIGHTVRAQQIGTNTVGSTTATTPKSAVIVAAAPTVSGAAIEGDAKDGSTLTAVGNWSGTTPITFTYQWQRETGGTFANISGAESQEYTLTGDDIGHAVRVIITATNTTGSVSETTDATAVVTAAAPVSQQAPSINNPGAPKSGDTLTVDNGQWGGTQPQTYTHQWQRETDPGVFVDIPGADQPTYTLTDDDIGHTVRVEVTATNGADSTTVASAPTGVVAQTSPVNTGLPTVAGTPADGQTLIADNGDWDHNPSSYDYQWQRETAPGVWVNIPGATSSSYTLTGDDIGHQVRVEVTAGNDGGETTVVSPATTTVVATAPTNETPPSVTGNPVTGEVLTANPGTYNGTTPTTSCQWQRETSPGVWVNIPGATSCTYTLTDDDIGKPIRVEVTAENPAGSTTTTSPATPAISAAAPANTASPVISGSTVVGQVLTTSNGTWTGTAPLAYSYQWQRCDANGNNCADIAGATSSSYTLVAADAGATLKVRVRASNSAGNNDKLSPATAVVTAAPDNGGNNGGDGNNGGNNGGDGNNGGGNTNPGDTPVTPPVTPIDPNDPWGDGLDHMCQNVPGGIKNKNVALYGKVMVSVKAVVPESIKGNNGITFRTSAKKGIIKSVTYTINGKKIKADKAYKVVIKFADMKPNQRQTLKVKVAPKKKGAKAKTIEFRFSSVYCTIDKTCKYLPKPIKAKSVALGGTFGKAKVAAIAPAKITSKNGIPVTLTFKKGSVKKVTYKIGKTTLKANKKKGTTIRFKDMKTGVKQTLVVTITPNKKGAKAKVIKLTFTSAYCKK